MTLIEYIQDCLRIRAEKRAEEDGKRTREQDEQQRRRTNALTVAVRQVRGGAIPEPLREFVAYDGDEPTEDQLRGFPDRWFPYAFKVDAPGLMTLHFITTTTGRESHVTSILVGPDKFGDDWIEAVAAAAIIEAEVKR